MNKRHYEHTLPNIRGSLSNTYTKRAANSYAGMSCVPEKGKMYVTKDIIRTRHGV